MVSEEDLEDGITPEVLPTQQLATLIKEIRLEPELANEFTVNFEEHFRMASEWSKKAKTIIVTNENQTVLMEQARVARLFIRSKRLEIENFRKQKKEYYLRGGQAIDKVCTFLKNIIEPIENHLDLQEHYIEYKKKAEEARLLAEAKVREERRLADEAKAQAEANARLQAENERLRNEQEKLKKENEAKIAEENKKRQAELARIQAENEAKLAKERAEREKVEAELRAKKQAEMKAEADRLRAEELAKSAGDTEKLLQLKFSIEHIFIPDVQSIQAKRIIAEVTSHLYLAKSKIIIEEEE